MLKKRWFFLFKRSIEVILFKRRIEKSEMNYRGLNDCSDLDNCSSFNTQTVKERRKTLAVKLCCGCYEPVTAHNSNICMNRRLYKTLWSNASQCPSQIHQKEIKDTSLKTQGYATSTDKTQLVMSNFAEMDVACVSTRI